DERARAHRGVRHAQGDRLRPRIPRAAHRRRIARHLRHRRRRRHTAHRAGRDRVQDGGGKHIPGVPGVARHRGDAVRVRAGGRARRGGHPGGALGARAHRRGAARDRLTAMPVPLHYVARNLWTRRLTTALTAGGLALVVFVFATVLMLDAGLKRTLVTTGEYDNVVAIRKGAETEIQSGIYRDQAAAIELNPAVAIGPDGRRLASKEVVVLISLNRIGMDK